MHSTQGGNIVSVTKAVNRTLLMETCVKDEF